MLISSSSFAETRDDILRLEYIASFRKRALSISLAISAMPSSTSPAARILTRRDAIAIGPHDQQQ